VSLQRDLRPGDDAVLRQHPNVIRCDPTPTDFADTAVLITRLDIVVCVDTAIVHLAGALGKAAAAVALRGGFSLAAGT